MLKKVLFFIFCFFFICSSAYCYSEDKLSFAEYQKYGVSYENDSLSSRLARLENDLFGMTQSGDIDKRIEMIVRMAEANSSTFVPPIQQYDIEKPKKKSTIKNFWNNLTSDLLSPGTMTGFTPPIYGYGNYNGNYSRGYNRYYGNNRFNGYGYPPPLTGHYPPSAYSVNNRIHHHPHNHSSYPHRHHRCCPHGFGHSSFYPNNTISSPMIYPSSQPIVPTESFNNYFTSSTVRILND